MPVKVQLSDIEETRLKIQNFIHRTETAVSSSASQIVGAEVFFKYENLQRTGSFKVRGAFSKIMSLTDAQKAKGVVASSAGNHAQGVALGARLAGAKATIVMPEGASLNKTSATRGYGADVLLHGDFYDEAYAKAREIEESSGAVFVHPYEDEKVIAGQGTLALEVLEAIPDLDSIVVSIGGGGLISGVATAIKALRPQCKVIGVQSAAAPGMERLFHKQPFAPPLGRIATLADGIAVKNPSKAMYDHFISKLVDDVVTVNDDEIAAAVVFLLERSKNLVEGSGAATLAAMMNRKLPLGSKTCAVLSGGNIDLNVIAKITERGLISQGRLTEISLVIDDQPGSLSRLTAVIAQEKANIIDIRHDRVERGLSLKETKVHFIVETTGPEHGARIRVELAKAGAKLIGSP